MANAILFAEAIISLSGDSQPQLQGEQKNQEGEEEEEEALVSYIKAPLGLVLG